MLLRRTMSSVHTECTIVYAWGTKDFSASQELILKISSALRVRGVSCYGVLEYQADNLHDNMMKSIDHADTAVVLITKEYNRRLSSGNAETDNAFLELQHVYTEKGKDAIIPVVIDKCMLDQSSWTGFLHLILGRTPFMDCTDHLDDDYCFNKLMDDLKELILKTKSVCKAPSSEESSPTIHRTNSMLQTMADLIKKSIGDAKHKRTFDIRVEFDGGKYEGEIMGGEYNGYGRYTWTNGNIYEGEYYHGVKKGYGIYTFAEGHKYEGQYDNNARNGKGKMVYANGSVYEGDWVNNQQTGNGKIVYADGDEYEGEFLDGYYKGHGVFKSTDGSIYQGEFKDDKPDGMGVMVYPSGNVYDGMWKDGLRHGQGKHTWKNGDVYEGGYVNGLQEGKGTYIYANGETFEGNYLAGTVVGGEGQQDQLGALVCLGSVDDDFAESSARPMSYRMSGNYSDFSLNDDTSK